MEMPSLVWRAWFASARMTPMLALAGHSSCFPDSGSKHTDEVVFLRWSTALPAQGMLSYLVRWSKQCLLQWSVGPLTMSLWYSDLKHTKTDIRI
jgi:hypothetical protein